MCPTPATAEPVGGGLPLPSLAGAAWLSDNNTRRVLAALAAQGHEARAVGGCVRNALLGLPVTDIDLTTPARPEAVIAAATAAGLKVFPTGIEHGTVTIVVDETPFEVTTLRRDVETFGRHATVVFTDDWAEDASRRDFTMNAIYAGGDGRVHDPLGGYADLVARRVRFIGDPQDRIREDYLRVLRFFRFHATYGEGGIDPAGLAACVVERRGLIRLSSERVRAELMKLLAARRAGEAVQSMFTHGLLVGILGVAPRIQRLKRLLTVEAALGRPADPLLRLGALAVAVAEDCSHLVGRLKLSNDERDGLVSLAPSEPQPVPGMSEAALRQFVYRHGRQAAVRRLLIAAAEARQAGEGGSSVTHWAALVASAEQWLPPVLPVGGRDAIALGLRPGPDMGRVLKAVEAWWIAEDFPADRHRVLAELQRRIAETCA